MKNDLISRSALIAEYDRVHVGAPGGARKLMEDAPAVDAEPVRHGYWNGKPVCGHCTVHCSCCRDAFLDNAGRWNYCPNCGAKMDEVTGNGNQ